MRKLIVHNLVSSTASRRARRRRHGAPTRPAFDDYAPSASRRRDAPPRPQMSDVHGASRRCWPPVADPIGGEDLAAPRDLAPRQRDREGRRLRHAHAEGDRSRGARRRRFSAGRTRTSGSPSSAKATAARSSCSAQHALERPPGRRARGRYHLMVGPVALGVRRLRLRQQAGRVASTARAPAPGRARTPSSCATA